MEPLQLRIARWALCAVLMAASAWAHAVLTASTPEPRSSVTGPDVAIRLKFNSRIDAAHSRVSVDNAGAVRDVTMDPQPSPDTLAAEIKGLAAGDCRIRWQVLAVDGHITRGELPFTVR